jgi:hypothetical protein
MKKDKEKSIRSIVRASVESFSEGFKGRHIGEKDDPDGTINSKIHNVFIAVLGEEIQYYSALVRSFDSTLGNMLEKMAINIARLSYEVKEEVIGTITSQQTTQIARILEEYKRHVKKPEVSDYQILREEKEGKSVNKRHESDYYLIDEDKDIHHLIELKIGGDLDNKKARSEKEALLEQFAILSNTLGNSKEIHIHFATAYNRYGEDNDWKQMRVRQYFADEELLISKDFWNFVCQSKDGYVVVLDEYKNCASLIKGALKDIKDAYLH